MFRDSLCVELGKIFSASIVEYSGEEAFVADTVYVNYIGDIKVIVSQESHINFEGFADLMVVSNRINKKSGWLSAKLSDFESKTNDPESGISVTTIDANEGLRWQSKDIFLASKRIKFNFTESFNPTREPIQQIDLSYLDGDNQTGN